MAKKNVVIFDGEDKFINPKKAVYNKARGKSKTFESFKSLRAATMDEEGSVEPVQSVSEQTLSQGSTPMAEQVMSNETIGAAQQYTEPVRTPVGDISVPSLPEVVVPPIFAPSLEDRKSTNPVYESPIEPIFQNITREPIYNAPTPQLPVYDDRKSINPVYESPTQAIFQPITEEPIYKAPIGNVPVRPTPPTDIMFPDDGSGYRGGKAPIFDDRLPNDGIPQGQPVFTPSPYQPNPIYTAPVPVLPVTTPPSTIILPDPMGGGGSPVMASPEIPRPKCPTGYVFNDTTGMCIDKRNPDIEIDPYVAATTSSTTTTTTILKTAVETTTSSTTTTTTKAAVVDKVCNPPIYSAPKYYKWVSKGNCAYELVVDDTQLKDAAPAPVLPAAGQPIFNVNLPTGALGTLPTTSTTVQTTTKSLLPIGGDSGGAAGGGGGGSPFPEETAPTVAPKKNYFWWYVGGALAIYLILKRKKSQ